MSRHYHDSECEVDALERIADAIERIAGVVDEWAEANRTHQLLHTPPPRDFGEQVVAESDLGRRVANGEKPRW